MVECLNIFLSRLMIRISGIWRFPYNILFRLTIYFSTHAITFFVYNKCFFHCQLFKFSLNKHQRLENLIVHTVPLKTSPLTESSTRNNKNVFWYWFGAQICYFLLDRARKYCLSIVEIIYWSPCLWITIQSIWHILTISNQNIIWRFY